MSKVKLESLNLIDALIKHWLDWDHHEDFYLSKLAPSLVADLAKGDDAEQAILSKLQILLTESEWQELPLIIKERREGSFRELDCDRAWWEEKRRQEEKEARRLARDKKAKELRVARKAQKDEMRKQQQMLREKHLEQLREHFKQDFINSAEFFSSHCALHLSQSDFDDEVVAFVQAWVDSNTPSPESGSKQLPDREQAMAIASVRGHTQVVARAGSGKTTTLVNRALFLIKHCDIAPGEILLLAFNRKAALEIRRRLLTLLHKSAGVEISKEITRRRRSKADKIEAHKEEIEANVVDAVALKLNISLPHVMTFHALAYSIVHPEESILFDGADGDAQGLSRVFQQVIDDHLQSPVYREEVRDLMLAHFREAWEQIEEGGYDLGKEEFLKFRRSLPQESLRGDYVKSYGEKLIADFLFEHDVAYKYERNHWRNEWQDGVSVKTNYRPDFTIFKNDERGKESGVIIEYFGLKGDPDYDDITSKKIFYWKDKPNWTLVDLYPSQIAKLGHEKFLIYLKETLESLSIGCNRLSEDEIWHRIKDRAIDRFTKTTVSFVGRCRKKSLEPSDLKLLVDKHVASSIVESKFLKLARSLYTSYLERLTETGDEDFDGLMQRSAEIVQSGKTVFHRKSGKGDLSAIRHICIDEYQDFSDLFYRLVSAIREVNPDVELFCVGDDWQAINGFAGSDLSFFNNFDRYIKRSSRLYISTNYRSSRSIVGFGNQLMVGLGKPATSFKDTEGQVILADLKAFEPTFEEARRHPGDSITPAVLRLVSNALDDGLDIVMLCRRNALPWFVNYPSENNFRSKSSGLAKYLELIRSYFPEDVRSRISISTAHKYKGLEKSVVIVLDAVCRSYPLIHPDWIFSRVLGDSTEKIVDEERRLFYVALTRAIDKLVIVYEKGNGSPFLDGLESIPLPLEWSRYRPVRGNVSRVIVRVGNQVGRGVTPTFNIKDLLRAENYRWQAAGWPGWSKSFVEDGFSIESLKREVWANQCDGIEVRVFDDLENLIDRYLVNVGKWFRI